MTQYTTQPRKNNMILALFLCAILTLGAALQGEGGEDEYDFLVLGGGTAGCVLASKLCSSGFSVGLLERGAPRTTEEEFYTQAYRLTFDAWNSESLAEAIPGRNAALADGSGKGGRIVPFYTGATLGGTTSINIQQMIIPVNGTIDQWGIDGLDTETAFKHFSAVYEQLHVSTTPEADFPDYMQPYLDAMRETVPEIPIFDKPIHGSDKEQLFTSQIPATPKGGFRIDSCSGFLTPVMDTACKDTLTLIQSATVTKILISDNKAEGVEYVDSSDKEMANKIQLKAKLEVISSMGPYGSPKVMQLSGIGPIELLEKHGIEQVAELPVGAATLARPAGGVFGSYSGASLDSIQNATEILSDASREQFEAGLGGPLSRACVAPTGSLGHKGYIDSVFGWPVENYPLSGLPIIGTFCAINPTSTGSIKISSSDPFATVEFDSNLLGNEKDMANMVACVERFRPLFSNFAPEIGMFEMGPGQSFPLEMSDWLKSTTETILHVVAGNGVGTVVDSELKVIGIEKLRVVDASAMPDLPVSAGPVASVFMLASFMSDKIIAEHTRRNPISPDNEEPAVDGAPPADGEPTAEEKPSTDEGSKADEEVLADEEPTNDEESPASDEPTADEESSSDDGRGRMKKSRKESMSKKLAKSKKDRRLGRTANSQATAGTVRGGGPRVEPRS